MSKYIFVPGDNWLYYKFYCGGKTSDELITTVILPVVNYLTEKQLICGWFFIRYSDPDLHIRVRFHISDTNSISEIMSEINKYIKPFIESDRIWKIMCDTYQREVERYNPCAIELSEKLFNADSIMIANFINFINGDEGEKTRWMFSFLSIDYLLSDFNYSIENKLVILENIKVSFAHEFGMNKMLKLQLDNKFRLYNHDINLIMNMNKNSANEYSNILHLLEERSFVNKYVFSKLKLLEEIKSSIEIKELLPSYIHMHMNRLFRSKQRLHEMVIYDFLWRYYRSILSKSQYLKQNTIKNKCNIVNY